MSDETVTVVNMFILSLLYDGLVVSDGICQLLGHLLDMTFFIGQ